MRILLSFLLGLCPFLLAAQTAEDITFQHEGLTLSGTLTLPDNGVNHPAIIINPGSGPADRNGTLPMVGGNVACLYPGLLGDTLRYYRDLGNDLTAAGYAVLRYDKVEYTYTSPAQLGELTFEKLWLPVRSAVDYLCTRTDIDTNRIVLLGHSEGSTIIPFIARQREGIRALVSVAGPRRPLDSLLAYQLPYIAETCNGDVATANLQAAQILGYFSLVRSGNVTGTTPPLFGVPAVEWADYIQMADSVAINYHLADLPILFVGLGEDINVPPAETDRLEAEVPSADVYRLPGLNHYLTTDTDPRAAAVVADTIVYWLSENLTSIIAAPNKWPKSFTALTDGEFLRVRSGGGPLERVVVSTPNGQMVARSGNVSDSYWEVKVNDWPAGWYAVSAFRGAYQQGEWVFIGRK